MKFWKLISISIVIAMSSCAQTTDRQISYSHPASGDYRPMQWSHESAPEAQYQPSQSYYRPDVQTIYYGMPAVAVESAWGAPSYVDYAGNDNRQFQKWHYPTSSHSGMNTNGRIVYIEHGRVVGWETLQGRF